MWWAFISWLIGAVICLVVANKLWQDGGDSLGDQPWQKR